MAPDASFPSNVAELARHAAELPQVAAFARSIEIVKPVEVATVDYGTCIWNQSKPDADGTQFGYVPRVDTGDERTPSGDHTWAVHSDSPRARDRRAGANEAVAAQIGQWWRLPPSGRYSSYTQPAMPRTKADAYVQVWPSLPTVKQ